MSISETTPDGPPGLPRPSATPPDGEPNLLRHYAGVVRRRYQWILLGLVVGLIGGFISTLFVHVSHDPISYYKATNTLLAPTANSSGSAAGSSGTNLQQAAFLLRSAAVTDEVAKKLGVTADVVNNQLVASARSDVQAVDVTAISTNPAKAVQMANVAAGALNEYVLAENQAQYTQEINDVKAKVVQLQNQQSDLEASLTAKGANAGLINAQIESVVNQYRIEYDQYQALLTAGAPTAGMSTLQAATPVQISGRAYQYRLSQNENARGQVGGTQQVAPAFDETASEHGPSGVQEGAGAHRGHRRAGPGCGHRLPDRSLGRPAPAPGPGRVGHRLPRHRRDPEALA